MDIESVRHSGVATWPNTDKASVGDEFLTCEVNRKAKKLFAITYQERAPPRGDIMKAVIREPPGRYCRKDGL